MFVCYEWIAWHLWINAREVFSLLKYLRMFKERGLADYMDENNSMVISRVDGKAMSFWQLHRLVREIRSLVRDMKVVLVHIP